MNSPVCKVCGGPTVFVGEKPGRMAKKGFELFRCPGCGFVFVANPWTEFDKIYSEDYYKGWGADPLVDYVFELKHPNRTIREYEWRGLVEIIRSLVFQKRAFRWLDYGCGNGGLVRFAQQINGIEIYGFEEGWIADEARCAGIQLFDRSGLELVEGSFDVVTAIEVMEHVLDPLETLRHIRRLLKVGGLFFCTTGNARKHRTSLLEWPYIIPEIHISMFEPSTLEKAFNLAGFRPEYPGFIAGHADVIECRTLKNLRIRTKAPWQALLPWSAMARIVDAYVGFTDHPIGWAE